MAMRRATMGGVLAIAVFALVVSALGALVTTRTLSNTGSITVSSPSPTIQLGVYSDVGCTTALSSVGWGTLNPGATSTATAYLRNEGNIPITLSVQTSNWNPGSASSYLTFSWDKTNFILAVNQTVQATLSLAVSSSITGITSFSFTITITATQ